MSVGQRQTEVVGARVRAVASLTAALMGAAGCGQVSGGVDTALGARTAAGTARLAGVEWQLQEITGPDGRWPVDDFDSVLRFDGRGGWSAQACNHLSGTSEPGDRSVDLTLVMTTEMACPGELGRLQQEVGAVLDGRVEVELTNGLLRLAGAGGRQLLYRERSSQYPTAEAETVVAGDRGGAQYRVAVSGEGSSLGLTIETRSAPGTAWDVSAFGAPAPELEPGLWTSGVAEVDGEQLIAGFAPPGTARVTHRASPRAASVDELVLDDLAGPAWMVWHGFVPHHDQGSQFVAYGEDGDVLKRW